MQTVFSLLVQMMKYCLPTVIPLAIFCPSTVVPTMGEWAVFILALLMISVGAVFMMGMENKKILATSSGNSRCRWYHEEHAFR